MSAPVDGGAPPAPVRILLVEDDEVIRKTVAMALERYGYRITAELADPRPVPLGELVADSVARTGLEAELSAAGAGMAQTDPRRVDRIVANLVVNAHRHGRGPVEVRVDGTVVVVRDHGPGFPPDLLREGPQRFRTGAEERGRGHGLGLTVASGQTRVLGGALTFANAPDGGAVATLALPPAAPAGA